MDYKSLDFERVCAVVDLDAITGNVREAKKRLTPGTKILAVVKANGYGHGTVPSALAALRGGADMLGVATAGEGVELRKAGIDADILMFGAANAYSARDVISHRLASPVYSLEWAKALGDIARSMGKTASVHIKLETGMNRVGFSADKAQMAELKTLWSIKGLEIAGIYSHLADSLNTDSGYTIGQLNKFLSATDYLTSQGCPVGVRHLSNSGAIVNYREIDLDMVRAGTLVYGLLTSEETRGQDWGFKPALTLLARIVQVKDIEPGETVGYTRSYAATKRRTIATVSMGYADGYSRVNSNKGRAIVNGVFATVAGIVCMDQLMLDVTDSPDVRPGDCAVFIGCDGCLELSAADVAATQGTVSLDVVTTVSPGSRVPRIYIN